MKNFLYKYRYTIISLAVCFLLFAGMLVYASRKQDEEEFVYYSYTVYEMGQVREILSDTSKPEPLYENAYVGNQNLLIEIKSGDYKGHAVAATNYLSSLMGTKLKSGDNVILAIYMDNGEIGSVSVYDFDRLVPVAIILGLFVLVTVIIGGTKGLKSLVGLALTFVSLIWILMPLLLKGFPTIITTLFICIYVAVLSYLLLGGISKKTICAMIGTAFGLLMAALFGFLSQALLRVDGMKIGEYVDSLLQLRLGGSTLSLRGLLIAGTLVSSLGAVMDVAMSISSAANELVTVNPGLTRKEVIKSGMNIGRDMIGTMTNTLILAFVGSSFVMVMYIFSMDYPFYELLSSTTIATELVHSISSSIGVIVSVPLTVVTSAFIYTRRTKV